jgi:hypothetical protein
VNGSTQIGWRTRAAVHASLRLVAISVTVVLFIAAVLAAIFVGQPGLVAVGLCAVVGLVLLGITVATHLFTLRHVDLMMAGMGADFLLKLLAIILAIFIARKISGLDPYVLFGTMLALILVQTIAFPVALARARIPLIETEGETSTSDS